MKWKERIIRIGALALVPVAIITLSSCTSKITEEQMMQLQELRKQERSLQDAMTNKKGELNRLKDEINMRKSELRNCEGERDLIKQRLSQWPNIWPDYQPNK